MTEGRLKFKVLGPFDPDDITDARFGPLVVVDSWQANGKWYVAVLENIG